ncbi:germination protein, Ger(X)C family [Halobacteroides halobius DSM 5150]|uniref:Germination protein, Ger(X)C family n=1 Tax=Halobacteroides halobius (strain ATCC 35273 / DSM 5150 / MD-1) TaxID=748449 RepID=L0KEE6_HALHC|nr:Ger(x)C family spore germination protein [Halobacteroides halobius]AGB42433.1 germination protein, Ger(X)C family [Halobacteroides halobius DSM 5150]
MNKQILLGLIISLLVLSGCAQKQEVDQLGIVILTAVDLDEKSGKYEVIVQMISPEKAGGGVKNQIWAASATGDTVMRAAKNLRAKIPKKIVWFHSNLIIIGEAVARQGLGKVIDFFARNQEIRYNSLFVVTEGKAANVLDTNPRFEDSLAQEIEGIYRNYKSWAGTYALNLKQMLVRLANKQYDEVTGRLTTYIPDVAPEGTYKQESLVKGTSKKTVAMSGMAIFKKGKLKGWFNRPETRGYLWITGEMKRGMLIGVRPMEKKKFSVDILEENTKLTPILSNGQIKFRLEIKAGVKISEQIKGINLTKHKNIAKTEKLIAEQIKDDIKAALEKAQYKYEADIFGYGPAIYRKYPEKWQKIKKEWHQIFPTVETNIKVKVTIKRLGMITKPIMMD